MPPAAKKAPADYLFALFVSAAPIVGSFVVTPSETRWIVFSVGVVMVLAVLFAATRPSTG
ncbi:MAG: hypothetical protein ACYC1D_00100 [Acidimicrobiales bacterium]